MRGLSKVAIILSIAVIAIGGQLFAPPPPASGSIPIEEKERAAFIVSSQAVIGRDWTVAEVSQFRNTHVAPATIKTLLSTAQIVDFLGITAGAGKDYLRALLDN